MFWSTRFFSITLGLRLHRSPSPQMPQELRQSNLEMAEAAECHSLYQGTWHSSRSLSVLLVQLNVVSAHIKKYCNILWYKYCSITIFIYYSICCSVLQKIFVDMTVVYCSIYCSVFADITGVYCNIYSRVCGWGTCTFKFLYYYYS
jgi:hypothetical protein